MQPIQERTTPEFRPPRHLVSTRAVRYWTVRALAGWVLLLVIETIAWRASSAGPVALWLLLLGITVLAAAAHLIVMPRWRYRVHRWESTGEAVYTQAGWFNQERRIAPVARIQTVDSRRGPIQQLFGLTTVTVTTASAAGPLQISGLDRDIARELVDELVATTGRHEDAT